MWVQWQACALNGALIFGPKCLKNNGDWPFGTLHFVVLVLQGEIRRYQAGMSLKKEFRSTCQDEERPFAAGKMSVSPRS
jgi:hypothetical protein